MLVGLHKVKILTLAVLTKKRSVYFLKYTDLFFAYYTNRIINFSNKKLIKKLILFYFYQKMKRIPFFQVN